MQRWASTDALKTTVKERRADQSHWYDWDGCGLPARRIIIFYDS